VSATAYFCRSMGGGMGMPGGWTMSMMWMRMPGQTWFGSGIAAEKLLPQPAIVARVVGISATIAGIVSLGATFLRPG
jgi:hypothetical protein